jgi:hypothetical protein
VQFQSKNFARKDYACPMLIRLPKYKFYDAFPLEFHLSTSTIKERKIKFEILWRAKGRHLWKSGRIESLMLLLICDIFAKAALL